jgi:hypothetical protein
MSDNQEVVMRVLICRQVTLIIGLPSPNESDHSPLDIQSGEDAVLGLPDFLLRLVELCLRVGALLESSDIVLFVGEVGEDRSESGVRLNEGVYIPAHYQLILRQRLAQTNQILLKIGHLLLVLGLLRT